MKTSKEYNEIFKELLEACEQAIEFLSGNNDNGKDVYHKLVEAVRKAKEMTDGSK